MGANQPFPYWVRARPAVTAATVLLLTGACLDRRTDFEVERNSCVTCHGSPDRSGASLLAAAPPTDLAGNTEPASPGVGAHARHLFPSGTHAAVDCAACHTVPTATDSPGHADSPLPAEVQLSGLALYEGYQPIYDGAQHTCSSTYCHREAEPQWTRPRDSADACGTCHGVPPAEPHVQYDECYRCHVDVVHADRTFRRPGWHVNGAIEVQVSCHSCHGSEESDAPPTDLLGSSDVTNIGVGAHQAHLRETARSLAVPCETCHVVPEEVTDEGHLDATVGAEVVFGGVATANGREPVWNRGTGQCSQSWCHGPSAIPPQSPVWTSTDGPLSCESCHGNPPPEPHPQVTACGTCHPSVADEQGRIINRALHVDGIVQFFLPQP